MSFSQLIAGLGNLFRWWVNVAPWEQAVRVRRGKTAEALGPGIHLRIPGLDRYYVESTKLRTISTPIQTVSTADHQAVTIRAQIQFRVRSYIEVFQSLHSPEETLKDLTMSEIAKLVRQREKEQLTPDEIEGAVTVRLDGGKWGLADLAVTVTDFAFVKTFRLIQQDDRWSNVPGMNNREYTESQLS